MGIEGALLFGHLVSFCDEAAKQPWTLWAGYELPKLFEALVSTPSFYTLTCMPSACSGLIVFDLFPKFLYSRLFQPSGLCFLIWTLPLIHHPPYHPITPTLRPPSQTMSKVRGLRHQSSPFLPSLTASPHDARHPRHIIGPSTLSAAFPFDLWVWLALSLWFRVWRVFEYLTKLSLSAPPSSLHNQLEAQPRKLFNTNKPTDGAGNS